MILKLKNMNIINIKGPFHKKDIDVIKIVVSNRFPCGKQGLTLIWVDFLEVHFHGGGGGVKLPSV